MHRAHLEAMGFPTTRDVASFRALAWSIHWVPRAATSHTPLSLCSRHAHPGQSRRPRSGQFVCARELCSSNVEASLPSSAAAALEPATTDLSMSAVASGVAGVDEMQFWDEISRMPCGPEVEGALARPLHLWPTMPDAHIGLPCCCTCWKLSGACASGLHAKLHEVPVVVHLRIVPPRSVQPTAAPFGPPPPRRRGMAHLADRANAGAGSRGRGVARRR